MKKILLKLTALTLLVFLAVAPLTACKKKVYYVKLTVRDYGEIVLELDREAAPITVDNFLSLVEDGFYDGLTFHRVIKNFMIQGGCPKGDGTGDSGTEITGEFLKNGHFNPISHKRGVISMARGDDMNSASCQFFICNADSPHLDDSYAAFGYVIEGMDVVDAITEATAPDNPYLNGAIYDKSLQAVIEKAEVLKGYNP